MRKRSVPQPQTIEFGGSRRQTLHPVLTSYGKQYEQQEIAKRRKQREAEEKQEAFWRVKEEAEPPQPPHLSASSGPSIGVVTTASSETSAPTDTLKTQKIESPLTTEWRREDHRPSHCPVVPDKTITGTKSSSLIWEKYGPMSAKDLVGLEKASVAAQEWFSTRRWGNLPVKKEMLLFVGPPGTGKTILARAILKTNGFKKIVELWPGIRGNKEIDDEPGELSRTLRRQTPKSVTGVRSAIILEELEELLRTDSQALMIKCVVPVIATCSQPVPRYKWRDYGKVIPLYPVRFGPGPVALVRRVVAAAGRGILQLNVIENMVAAADGDLRQLVISAAFFSNSNISVNVTRRRTLEEFPSVFDRLRAMTKGDRQAPLGACDLSVLCVYENYLSLAKSDGTIDRCAKFSETLALQDVQSPFDLGGAWTGLAAKAVILGVSCNCPLRPARPKQLTTPDRTFKHEREALLPWAHVTIS
jgi:hypothetical protein